MFLFCNLRKETIYPDVTIKGYRNLEADTVIPSAANYASEGLNVKIKNGRITTKLHSTIRAEREEKQRLERVRIEKERLERERIQRVERERQLAEKQQRIAKYNELVLKRNAEIERQREMERQRKEEEEREREEEWKRYCEEQAAERVFILINHIFVNDNHHL